MKSDFDIDSIPGASQLRAAFGGDWPSFHDAEVLTLCLSRENSSWLKLHILKTTNKVDSDGNLLHENDLIVIFRFERVKDVELSGFNHQNVIAGLNLKHSEGMIELSLLGCFGLCGTISAENVSIEFEPSAA
ncbi:hypothetical protein BH10CYA1_BH10CYA1_61820 [soil metagenome]